MLQCHRIHRRDGLCQQDPAVRVSRNHVPVTLLLSGDQLCIQEKKFIDLIALCLGVYVLDGLVFHSLNVASFPPVQFSAFHRGLHRA